MGEELWSHCKYCGEPLAVGKARAWRIKATHDMKTKGHRRDGPFCDRKCKGQSVSDASTAAFLESIGLG